MSEQIPASYARRVGDRLRKVRKQQRLSLQAVEASSEEEFKASVLGAYERGERAISVPRLQRLARFYNVPVDQLLPRDEAASPARRRSTEDVIDLRDDADGRVSIDLTNLESTPSPERDLLARYLGMIQVQRQDFNGRVLTIRHDDVRALACILDRPPEQLHERLAELGLRR